MRTLLYSASLSLLIAGCADSKTDPPPTQTEQNVTEIDNSQTVPEQQPKSSEPSQPQAEASNLSAVGSDLSANHNEFNIQVNLSSDVLFDFGKANLKPEAEPELQQAAQTLKSKGKGIIAIVGHTDNIGSDAANQKLSLQRAEAVRDYFKAQGIDLNYQISGMGESQPLKPNTLSNGEDNPEGRQKNRRVEIVINKTKSLSES
ncbi:MULTISPECIES: OmpA family protein [unclassified Acinetobacter]|uniref:OmpA family protein n=1 Tax=unclassified Acinetobacter TaxID=196816 RepID=UPI0015D222AD|nr:MULTISPECIES: OmpA family protein [unclassified Acinetobacter]